MADGLAFARTATLLGSVLTALSSGTNYVYSAYAPQLGSRLHITHTQLNIIGLSGNMGVYTTGPVFGRLVDKRGPKPLLISAVILLFVGYTGLRVYYNAGPSSVEVLPFTSLMVMSIFSYMTGAGGCAGLTASANSTAKSFPDRMRATTVGFVISGFGLSAFFFSTLANWIFPGDTSSFLLFLSFGTAVPVIIGFLTIRPIPHPERPDAGPGGLMLPSDPNVTNSSTRFSDGDLHEGADEDAHTNDVPATNGNTEFISENGMQSRRHSIELSPTRSIVGRRASSSRRSTSRAKSVVHSDPADIHGKRLLFGWEFWLLFTILSLQSGTGLMYINNVGSISQALFAKGDSHFDRIQAGKVQAAQVSIISLANFASRVAIGAGADFAKSRFAMHRSYLLSLISTLFIISQMVGSRVEDVDHLWKASVLLGLGYGGIFGLLPTITIEWFGLSHFSENWGFVSMAPLLGGNLFSILFGRYIDARVPVSTDNTPLFVRLPDHDEPQCLEGRECYAGAMSVTTFACVLGLCLSLIAAWRDRRRALAENKYQSIDQEVIWEEGSET